MEEVQNSASCKVSVLEETAIIITVTSLVFQTEGLGLKVGKDNLAQLGTVHLVTIFLKIINESNFFLTCCLYSGQSLGA